MKGLQELETHPRFRVAVPLRRWCAAMLLLLLSTSKPKVIVSGLGTKRQTCEVCAHDYSYVISREAEGEDKSWFSWTEAISRRKAAENARRNLAKCLESEVDPVPCSDCGWIQESMIRAVRKRSYRELRRMATAGIAVGFAGFALALVALSLGFFLHAQGGDPEKMAYMTAAFGGVLALIGGIPGVSFWTLRHLLNSQYEPNRSYGLARS